jgi:hypothetical protein
MLAVLLLSLAVQDAPASTPPVSAKPKKERKICRPIETTGTRMGPARECRTAAEWNAMGGNISQRDLDRITRTPGNPY